MLMDIFDCSSRRSSFMLSALLRVVAFWRDFVQYLLHTHIIYICCWETRRIEVVDAPCIFMHCVCTCICTHARGGSLACQLICTLTYTAMHASIGYVWLRLTWWPDTRDLSYTTREEENKKLVSIYSMHVRVFMMCNQRSYSEYGIYLLKI